MSKAESLETYDAFKQLTKLCQEYFEKDPNTVFFIDLDSTIYDVSPRNQAILRTFAEIKPKLSNLERFRSIDCYPGEYGYDQALKRIGFNDEPILANLRNYWLNHFFSNSFLHEDKIFNGADFFLENIFKITENYFFLSGRHHDSMWDGTVSSLKKYNFFKGDEKIILKKNKSILDGEFKKSEIARFKNDFSHFVLIDNEPVVLNKVAELYNDINLKLIFFDTCHSQKEQISPLARKIKVHHQCL